jgi:hypothetical protein
MKIRIVFLVLFLQTVAGAQVQNAFFGFNWAANNVVTPPDNNPWPTAIRLQLRALSYLGHPHRLASD